MPQHAVADRSSNVGDVPNGVLVELRTDKCFGLKRFSSILSNSSAHRSIGYLFISGIAISISKLP